jgi:thiol-disulfide isomerase/thioredoxin
MVRLARSLVFGLAVAGGLAALAAVSRLTYIVPAAAGSVDTPELRPPVPDLVFADGSNMPVHLGHFAGQVLIVNFWASWVGPSVKETAALDRLQGDLRGLPLAILAICEDKGGIAVARDFLARQKFTFLRPFADPNAGMAHVLNVRGLPTTLVIDRHGRLVSRVEGPSRWDDPDTIASLRHLAAER